MSETFNRVTVEQITNLYLYGQNTTPQDLATDSILRSADTDFSINVNINYFMETGAGRFALGPQFLIVKEFFERASIDPGTYTKAQLADELNITHDFILSFQQYNFGDGVDDYVERVWVYNSSAFRVGFDDVRFVVSEGGERTITNYAVVPYRGAAAEYDDNFDFSSDDFVAGISADYNLLRVDPSDIGRSVGINFTGNVQKVTYTSEMYNDDVVEIASWDFYPEVNIPDLLSVLPDLFDAGVTNFSKDGMAIAYGSPQNDDLDTNDLEYHPYLDDDANQNGIMYFLGAGDDYVSPGWSGQSGNFYVDGGSGVDTASFQDNPLSGRSGGGVKVDVVKVESVEGSPFGDEITILQGPTLVIASGGLDTVVGSSGNDSISGGSENDKLSGSGGDDLIDGTEGDDEISGGAGKDRLSGAEGADTIQGGDQGDVLFGGAGLDKLIGGDGSDFFIVGDGEILQDATASDRIGVSPSGAIAGVAKREEGSSEPYVGMGYEFEDTGGALEIKSGGNLIAKVVGWEDGDLGIQLEEEDDPDDPEPEDPDPPWPEPIIPPPSDPLVLDLDGDGIEFVPLGSSTAHFDLNEDGFRELVGWLAPDDGFLIGDANNNGNVDGHQEMFGDDIQHSYQALSSLDTSSNQKIDEQDAGFNTLRIWRDLNQDGESQPGELTTLGAEGITSISLQSEVDGGEVLGVGIIRTSTFERGELGEGATASVLLPRKPLISTWTPPEGFTVSAGAAEMPELRGYGTVRNLSAEMTLDADLLTAVRDLVTDLGWGDYASVRTEFEAVLFKWVGADGVSPTSRGQYVDARHLVTIEKLTGTPYVETWGGVTSSNPSISTGADAEEVYENIVDSMLLRFLSQASTANIALNGETVDLRGTDFAVAEAFVYDPVTDELYWGPDRVIEALTSGAPTDPGELEAHYLAGLRLLRATALGTESDQTMDRVLEVLPHLNGISSSAAAALLKEVYGVTTLRGTSAADHLAGPAGNWDGDLANLYLGGSGNDTLEGNWGVDVYQYNVGDGHDRIIEEDIADVTAQFPDRILLGPGITPEMVELELVGVADGERTLLITFTGQSGSITIEDQLNPNNRFGIEFIEFADGTVWDRNDLAEHFSDIGATNGDDFLAGTSGADTLNGLLGDDLLAGAEGGDKYVYSPGDGDDTIEELEDAAGNDVLAFSAGIAPGDLKFENTGAGLIISFTSRSGSIALPGQFHETRALIETYETHAGIEGVSFADGTSWTGQDLLSAYFDYVSTNDDDTIKGFNFADTLNGGAGDDVLIGARGSDVYEYAQGDGADIIRDLDPYYTVDTLKFSGGIASGDLVITRQGEDAVITFSSGAGSILLENQFTRGEAYSRPGVERFAFSGGETWTRAEFQDHYLEHAATAGDDEIVGFNEGFEDNGRIEGDDTLAGGAGNDTLEGLRGSDTFLFESGDGEDSILDDGRGGGDFLDPDGATDRLRLGPGILPADVTVTREGDTAVLRIGTGGDEIRLVDEFVMDEYEPQAFANVGVEKVVFENGTEWTREDLLNAAVSNGGTNGADTIQGGTGADTLEGKAGDDLLLGGDGADRYVWNRGDGADVINEATQDPGEASEIDKIAFGSGIAPEDITVVRHGNDAWIVVDGEPDAIVIRNHFFRSTSDAVGRGIEQFIFANGTNWSRTQIDGSLVDDDLGTGSDDSLGGSSGVDHVWGGAGADTIDGGDGDDVLAGEDGADSITGGAGEDVAVYSSPDRISIEVDEDGVFLVTDNDDYSDGVDRLTEVEFIEFADGSPRIALEADTGGLVGTAGNDSIQGTAAAEIINGLAGNDTLAGQGGDDELRGGGGSDRLLGGDGLDSVFGGADGDQIDGDAGDDNVYGGDGNDSVNGGAGMDLLYGDAGSDRFQFNVGDGEDTIREEYDPDSDDVLAFGAGIAPGDIQVTRSGDTVTLQVGSTNDRVVLVDQFSVIEEDIGYGVEKVVFANGVEWTVEDLLEKYLEQASTPGADTIQGAGTSDTLVGGTGPDLLIGGDGADSYNWSRGDGSDVIRETFQWVTEELEPDEIRFSAGVSPGDITLTREGNDLVISVSGDPATLLVTDHFYQDENRYAYGVEKLVFSNGVVWNRAQIDAGLDDDIIGTSGNDSLTGTSGADQIWGRDGDDTVSAGDGDDFISGGFGSNKIDGGAGFDTVDLGPYWVNLRQETNGSVVVTPDYDDQEVLAVLQGVERIVYAGGEMIARLGDNSDNSISAGAEDKVFGLNGNDTIVGSNVHDDLDGGAGNDQLAGGQDYDWLEGAVGNDSLTGDGGDDGLYGGSGNDTLAGGVGDDYLEGGEGVDHFLFAGTSAGFDYVDGGDGADEIQGGANNTVIGLSGIYDVESINAGGFTGVTIVGTNGGVELDFTNVDLTGIGKIAGGDGSDTLIGSADADTLEGSAGDDLLRGGEGGDHFVFGPSFGDDAVVDFDRAEGDKIVFDDSVLANYAAVTSAATQVGADVKIVAGDDTLILQGVTLSSLQASDFLFA